MAKNILVIKKHFCKHIPKYISAHIFFDDLLYILKYFFLPYGTFFLIISKWKFIRIHHFYIISTIQSEDHIKKQRKSKDEKDWNYEDGFHTCAVIPAFLVEKVGLGALTPDRGETTRSGAKGDTGELMLGPNGVMGGEKQWVDLYEAEGLYGDGNGLEGTEGDLETL